MASGTRQRIDRERHIARSEFWDELCRDVFGPRSGGAIIFVDAENARKGVAKTSGAVAVAQLLSRAFRYDLSKDDLTLSAGEYLKRYQEHPDEEQPSVLVIDEFVGAGGGDARRAMSNQNVDIGSAWQMLRTKRVVTLATLPDWNEADPRLRKYADYRLWCRERPIGYFQPYKVTTPFNGGGEGPQAQVRGLNYHGRGAARIQFPNMDRQNDPYYQHVSKLKDELIHSGGWDADSLADDGEDELDPEDVEWNEQARIAIRMYKPWDDDHDATYRDVAEVIEDKSYKWVGNRVREWEDGEHRELVEDPRQTG